MNRSTSNSEHFLETLKRHFDNGAREFTIKVSYMADPQDHYRPRWSPFQPKNYIMTYEIIPTEAEEIPTAFYDPNIAEEITKEGRKTLAEMLKYTEVCPDCGGEGYTFFVDQGEPDPDSKCTTCKGTGKIKLKR